MAKELERSTILAALRNADGNVGKAARELGASRRTLQNRMREYGIPKGKSGRRKRLLPYRAGGKHRGLLGLGLGAAAVGIGVALYRRGGGA